MGREIYGLADLFSGYDGRILVEVSRPLTTFVLNTNSRWQKFREVMYNTVHVFKSSNGAEITNTQRVDIRQSSMR